MGSTPNGNPVFWDPTEDVPEEPRERAVDRQVGGAHYKEVPSQMQPWEIARAWGLGAWRFNVLKYLLRCFSKGGVEDLKKARHYLDYVIENYDELRLTYGDHI